MRAVASTLVRECVEQAVAEVADTANAANAANVVLPPPPRHAAPAPARPAKFVASVVVGQCVNDAVSAVEGTPHHARAHSQPFLAPHPLLDLSQCRSAPLLPFEVLTPSECQPSGRESWEDDEANELEPQPESPGGYRARSHKTPEDQPPPSPPPPPQQQQQQQQQSPLVLPQPAPDDTDRRSPRVQDKIEAVLAAERSSGRQVSPRPHSGPLPHTPHGSEGDVLELEGAQEEAKENGNEDDEEEDDEGEDEGLRARVPSSLSMVSSGKDGVSDSTSLSSSLVSSSVQAPEGEKSGGPRQFDRYGFLITERTIKDAQALEDPRRVRKENERLLKWQKMLSQFDKYRTVKADKLARRTWKGLPDAVRGEVWKKFTCEVQHKENKPLTLQWWSQQPVDGHVIEQIRKDVPRTFPTNEFFARLDPHTGALVHNMPGHSKLDSVLRAYAALDPEVEYCQGMNFIASVPLFYLPVEDAFTVFVFLMQGLDYRQYFLPNFPRLQRSVAILQRLMAKHLPKLYKHLKKEEVPLDCFVVQWFLTMFTYNLPFPAIIRMWDWLFVDGHDIVFAVALAVLKLVQSDMLKLRSTDLLQFAMTFSGQLDLTPDFLIAHALEFRSVLKTVSKLRLKAPDTYCLSHEVDLYASGNRYQKDSVPFYLRNQRRKV